MLKTWIPATTDFRDQGLDPTDWVNDNVEMATDGKLGKCLYFNGSNARLSSNTYSLGEKWSWSVWIKDDPDVTGWRIVFILNSNGSDADTQTALWVKADETRLEVCNDAKWVSTVKYIPGQWNHIAQTYDGTTTNVYLNGSRISGFTSPDHLVRTNMTIGGRSTNVDGGHVSANNYYKGYLNDLRIWDNEVLTPLEVKRLSQGLVLHYRLSGVGGENLLKYQIKDSQWSLWGYDVGTREKVVIDGHTWAHVVQNESTQYGGFSINPDGNQIIIDSSKKYTWSCLAKAGTKTNAEIILWCYWQSTEGGGNLSQNSKKIQLSSIPKRISWTLPQYTNPNYAVNRIRLMMGTYGPTNNEVYFTDVKFEEGDKATPWCPNPEDSLYSIMGFDDGIEYDCSGFRHNGTRTGTITWDANSARYTTCYEMTGATYINCGKPYEYIPDGAEEFTINMWAYKDAWDTSTQLYSCTESGGFSMQTGNNSVSCWCHVYSGSSVLTNSSGATITNSGGDPILLSTASGYISFGQSYTLDSGWHMFTMVYSTEGLKLYVDGNLARNAASTSIGLHYNKNCNLFIGAEATGGGGCTSPYLEGKASDYRLFSTALDDDSILALYNLGGSLDSNGVFHTYEYTEQ